jgi:hypothetical protein
VNIDEDVLIVLRAAKTLRGLQRSLRLVTWGTPEYARLLTAVKLMEAQFDEALEHVSDRIFARTPADAVEERHHAND